MYSTVELAQAQACDSVKKTLNPPDFDRHWVGHSAQAVGSVRAKIFSHWLEVLCERLPIMVLHLQPNRQTMHPCKWSMQVEAPAPSHKEATDSLCDVAQDDQ
jgi:hypothetical protein